MPLTEDGDRLAHDPAVDGRHEAMALRLREEGVGGLHTPMLVRQAQQNLAPRTCRVLRRQGYDRLRVQLKVALVHRSGEAHASSAARRTSAVRPLAAVIATTPMLTPSEKLRSPHTQRNSSIARSSFPAISAALVKEQYSRRTPNSSPPRRASVSRLHKRLLSSWLILRSRSSPAS